MTILVTLGEPLNHLQCLQMIQSLKKNEMFVNNIRRMKKFNKFISFIK